MGAYPGPNDYDKVDTSLMAPNDAAQSAMNSNQFATHYMAGDSINSAGAGAGSWDNGAPAPEQFQSQFNTQQEAYGHLQVSPSPAEYTNAEVVLPPAPSQYGLSTMQIQQQNEQQHW